MKNSPSSSAEIETTEINIPTYQELRNKLGGKIIGNYWVDADVNPKRAAYRPSQTARFGQGRNFRMPLAASWVSTGPKKTSSGAENVIAFPRGVDPSFLNYMTKIGVLGTHVLRDFEELKPEAEKTGLPLYNIDDLPDDWDQISANDANIVRKVNTKKYLDQLSGYAAPYKVVDLRSTTTKDLDGLTPRFFIKKNNTEASGRGVIICNSPEQYQKVVQELLQEAVDHNLDTEIVLQPEVEGQNSSFQFFIHPDHPKTIDVIAVTKQFVREDGKTYLGSENIPLKPENISPELTAVMLDMANKLRQLSPKIFGFVMCDYFQTPKNGILTFDPGLRQSGNTATTLARMFVEEITHQPGEYFSHLVEVPAIKDQTPFEEHIRPLGNLAHPENAIKEGVCVLPWGYNHVQGASNLIAIAKSKADIENLITEIRQQLK